MWCRETLHYCKILVLSGSLPERAWRFVGQNYFQYVNRSDVSWFTTLISLVSPPRVFQGQALGPLELQISTLQKQIEARNNETIELQQFWLRNQSELVKTVQRVGQQSEEVKSLKKQYTILLQKKLRTEGLWTYSNITLQIGKSCFKNIGKLFSQLTVSHFLRIYTSFLSVEPKEYPISSEQDPKAVCDHY